MVETTAVALFDLMTRFVRTVAVAGGAELRGFDLSPAQYQILVSIDTEPGLAQWELVRRFGVTKGNISQLIKKLEGSGLVVRTGGGRTDGWTLTPAGGELVGRIVPAHDDFMERQFAVLGETDRLTLLALLRWLVG